MEFGASFDTNVMYTGDTTGDNYEEFSCFMERARTWLDKAGIVLGEGEINFVEFSEGPPMYRLTAPRISGPRNIIEAIEGL